jgi:predicted negative regulator of RcsB-dependent stress response
VPDEFKPLAEDRRGDVLMAQGKKDEAVKAYQQAYKTMEPTVDYRRFIEGKLVALGHAPETPAAPKLAP